MQHPSWWCHSCLLPGLTAWDPQPFPPTLQSPRVPCAPCLVNFHRLIRAGKRQSGSGGRCPLWPRMTTFSLGPASPGEMERSIFYCQRHREPSGTCRGSRSQAEWLSPASSSVSAPHSTSTNWWLHTISFKRKILWLLKRLYSFTQWLFIEPLLWPRYKAYHWAGPCPDTHSWPVHPHIPACSDSK